MIDLKCLRVTKIYICSMNMFNNLLLLFIILGSSELQKRQSYHAYSNISSSSFILQMNNKFIEINWKVLICLFAG